MQYRRSGNLYGAAAMTPEDAVPAGADEGGNDEQDEGEQKLPLQELHNADDGDDHGQEPESHGVPFRTKGVVSTLVCLHCGSGCLPKIAGRTPWSFYKMYGFVLKVQTGAGRGGSGVTVPSMTAWATSRRSTLLLRA